MALRVYLAGPTVFEPDPDAIVAIMHEADDAVFCLDGFRRSPAMDPGTALEIGFILALGKPLAAWTRDPRSYPERVRA